MPNSSKEVEMFIHKKIKDPTIVVNLDYLICSLYTLYGSHKVFKKLNLKNDLYFTNENIEYFSNFKRVENLYELESLLNKPSLKQFAFYLLAPFLNLNSFFNNEAKFFNDEVDKQIILLKKYLRKFNRNYKRYFFYQNGTYTTLPTNKEINTYGIESLFLLTGL